MFHYILMARKRRRGKRASRSRAYWEAKLRRKFRDAYIVLTPKKYVESMEWQVSPEKLTPERLLVALQEDSHGSTFTLADAKMLLKLYGSK